MSNRYRYYGLEQIDLPRDERGYYQHFMVFRDDGDVIARINHAFIDERNKFHRLKVDEYWKED